jgi:hypothetical protein
LQDVLTDRKIPRAIRGRLPVLAASEAPGELLWVADVGVAADRRPAAGARAALAVTVMAATGSADDAGQRGG